MCHPFDGHQAHKKIPHDLNALSEQDMRSEVDKLPKGLNNCLDMRFPFLYFPREYIIINWFY